MVCSGENDCFGSPMLCTSGKNVRRNIFKYRYEHLSFLYWYVPPHVSAYQFSIYVMGIFQKEVFITEVFRSCGCRYSLGESPDASSFCQFLLPELLWTLAPAPTANVLPFLQLVKQKNIILMLFCWACFGRDNEQGKNPSCILKKYGM